MFRWQREPAFAAPCSAAIGMSYEDLCEEIVELSLKARRDGR